jgi:protein TonB
MPTPIYPSEGMDFSGFMVANMKYPDEAKKLGVTGSVELFFVIEPSGNITNLKVESGVGAGCSQEAMRLMKLLRWHPGIKADKAVRTAIRLSITFNIDDSDNMRYVPSNNTNQI